MTIGMVLVTGSARKARATSRPLRSGMRKSRKIRSNGRAPRALSRASASASWPLDASVTSMPQAVRFRRSTTRFASTSSTTNTRRPFNSSLACPTPSPVEASCAVKRKVLPTPG